MDEINRCLGCYRELKENEIDFHPKCSRLLFGTATAPTLSLTNDELKVLAKEIVKRSVTIPGVQPKLSLSLEKNDKEPKKSRLTIVGLWGNYILKPQSERFENLPENEDLVMHLAAVAGIETASHALLRTDSGQLVYVTKRFDRVNGKKIPMEDFCQLAELPSANKYKSTMEKAGALITKYSSPATRASDLIKYFDLAVFCFLVGNSDMHLKNFSIIKDAESQYKLSPAYDLLSSNLAMPSDQEQTALHLNGKKNRIKKIDFISLGVHIGLTEALVEKIIRKYDQAMLKQFEEYISISFLSDEMKEKLNTLIFYRFKIFQ